MEREKLGEILANKILKRTRKGVDDFCENFWTLPKDNFGEGNAKDNRTSD